jgi:hypothetical protein
MTSASLAAAAMAVLPASAQAVNSPHPAYAAAASEVTTHAVQEVIASNACSGKSKTHIVKKFFRGPAVYPLRYGTKTWGYNHLLKHGYDPSQIALTVARGQENPPFQYFTYKVNACPSYTYKVVYNAGALNGTGVRPQGIITAYAETSSAMNITPLSCL